MQIHCLDNSNGRLFFSFDFLFELNKFEYDVIIYLPDKIKRTYGSFFDHFPNLSIVDESKLEKGNALNIIFSDLARTKNIQLHNESLIYPIILKNERLPFLSLIEEKRFLKFRNTIMPDFSSDTAQIYKPHSIWAMDMLQRQISRKQFENTRFLITAGPTIEDIDPVRYLTNRSSGKMGIALARAAYIAGAEVTLICGPGITEPPAYLNPVRIRSAFDMYQAVIKLFEDCEVFISSAAVADFKPAEFRKEKIKKKEEFSELILQPTKDILKEISQKKNNQLVVGFSVETRDMIENSKAKLVNKNLDLIVMNNPMEKGAAFDAETNIVTVLYKDGHTDSWPVMSKLDVSKKLMTVIKKLLKN